VSQLEEQATCSPTYTSHRGWGDTAAIDLDIETPLQVVGQPNQTTTTARVDVPRWTAASAGAAPILLISGCLVAASLQPATYNPVRDTISSLAAPGATDSWVMTAVILAVGACYLTTAVGLRAARWPGRVGLAGGGVATTCIAAFPTPLHGYSHAHAFAVVAAAVTMCAWPVLAAHPRHRARVMTHIPNAIATVVTLSLVIWFALASGGAEVGLAERCAAVAPALWLFPVAYWTRRSLPLEVAQ
jgi:hypothetical membrane protein